MRTASQWIAARRSAADSSIFGAERRLPGIATVREVTGRLPSGEVPCTVQPQSGATHMKPAVVEDPKLAEIVRRLVDAYQPEAIYLFGSTARGAAGPDSDYDLLVIVPDSAEPERRRSRLAYQALRGTGAAADVIVSTRSRFDSRVHVKTSLPAIVRSEGKLLHAA